MSEELISRIRALKSDKNAVILAHNYQRGEIQDIADFTGDSLDLSRRAARARADLIVFCGVNFMAETAKILSYERTVIVPDPTAGCPMADMITADGLRDLKRQHPDAVVVCYVNTTADVKAESDICCTSANAVKVVQSIPRDRAIIFIPDKSLGQYVESKSARKMILWPGYCPTHHRILAEDVKSRRAEHPDAVVVVHPECTPDVIALADQVASTTGMVEFARRSPASTFIIGTETGLLHRLEKENPDKHFVAASPRADCPNMKLNTLEKLMWALADLKYEVDLREEVALRARQAIDRMLVMV